MTDLETIQRRFYRDGPEWPNSAEDQAAERAYRKAFLAAARQAAKWPRPDEAAIRRAWETRRQARRKAEDGESVMRGISREKGLWVFPGAF